MSDYTPTTEQVRKYWLGKWAPSDNLDAQFDRWLAEVERAAAARALEEFADQMTTGFNAGTLNAERRAIKREARARAAEIREGERHEVL